MARKQNGSSPSKSDASPLPSLDPSLMQDGAAGESTSSITNIGDIHNLDILDNTQHLSISHDIPTSHQSPQTHDAAHESATEGKPERSASVIAAEAAKRRENNFLEKLWK
jgi:hypothetical protein